MARSHSMTILLYFSLGGTLSLKGEVLIDLENTLPTIEITLHFTKNLHSIRKLHLMSIEKELRHFKEIILNLRFFFILHDIPHPSMSLKLHVILDHYSYSFERTNQTFKGTSQEYIESCHSTLSLEEEKAIIQKLFKKFELPIKLKKV